jgi:dephospho-CoA kinase
MSESQIVLAVVGLPGAGKSEATQYIFEKTGWPKVYFGDVIFDEMKRRHLPVNEANERATRNDIRAKFGMGACATISMPKIKEYFRISSVVIESFYSWEEYKITKGEFQDNFLVLAVYASPQTRIDRLAHRAVRPLTKAEAIARDFSQIEEVHQAGPIARADFTIINESSRDYLFGQIDLILAQLRGFKK